MIMRKLNRIIIIEIQKVAECGSLNNLKLCVSVDSRGETYDLSNRAHLDDLSWDKDADTAKQAGDISGRADLCGSAGKGKARYFRIED